MKIGIDLDGVVFDSERIFRDMAATYDKSIGGKGLVCPDEIRVAKRHDWSGEQCQKFLDMCLYDVEDIAPLVPLAKETIKMFLEDGHEIMIVTSRCRPREIEITERRMNEEGLDFPVIYTRDSKVPICQRYGVDVMIDDYDRNIDELSSLVDKELNLFSISFVSSGLFSSSVNFASFFAATSWAIL